MPLSSNSLIHFTKDRASLLGILENNFRVKYCTETYKFGTFDVTAKVPMVSFCDIPLSEMKAHIGSYGSYGIGLTRQWALKRGLNPVFYIEAQSALSTSMATVFREYVVTEAPDDPTDSQLALLDLLRYMKNYQAELVRKSETRLNYRFSDEREWRYAPKVSKKYEMILGIKEYDEDPKKHDSSVASLRLHFVPDDIKYIIVKDDFDIKEFVDHLRRVKGARYTHDAIERLATRLLTTEQIMEDF